MTKTKRTKFFPIFALTLAVSAVLFSGSLTAYAATENRTEIEIEAETETLKVDNVWLTGDILHIAVTDKNTAKKQTLELNLLDYAKASDEFVTVQAVDRDGNTSNAIQFKNPYYKAEEMTTSVEFSSVSDEVKTETTTTSDSSVSAVSDNSKPFTPDGTGTVIDNATNADGKEFFSIKTDDGNEFYIVVDRQRTADNVYLLNAVSENDLASLAKQRTTRFDTMENA
jgi:hypothetical protein